MTDNIRSVAKTGPVNPYGPTMQSTKSHTTPDATFLAAVAPRKGEKKPQEHLTDDTQKTPAGMKFSDRIQKKNTGASASRRKNSSQSRDKGTAYSQGQADRDAADVARARNLINAGQARSSDEAQAFEMQALKGGLRDDMDGIGTDEESIFERLDKATAAQRQALLKDQGFVNQLRKELSSEQFEQAMELLKGDEDDISKALRLWGPFLQEIEIFPLSETEGMSGLESFGKMTTIAVEETKVSTEAAAIFNAYADKVPDVINKKGKLFTTVKKTSGLLDKAGSILSLVDNYINIRAAYEKEFKVADSSQRYLSWENDRSYYNAKKYATIGYHIIDTALPAVPGAKPIKSITAIGWTHGGDAIKEFASDKLQDGYFSEDRLLSRYDLKQEFKGIEGKLTGMPEAKKTLEDNIQKKVDKRNHLYKLPMDQQTKETGKEWIKIRHEIHNLSYHGRNNLLKETVALKKRRDDLNDLINRRDSSQQSMEKLSEELAQSESTVKLVEDRLEEIKALRNDIIKAYDNGSSFDTVMNLLEDKGMMAGMRQDDIDYLKENFPAKPFGVFDLFKADPLFPIKPPKNKVDEKNAILSITKRMESNDNAILDSLKNNSNDIKYTMLKQRVWNGEQTMLPKVMIALHDFQSARYDHYDQVNLKDKLESLQKKITPMVKNHSSPAEIEQTISSEMKDIGIPSLIEANEKPYSDAGYPTPLTKVNSMEYLFTIEGYIKVADENIKSSMEHMNTLSDYLLCVHPENIENITQTLQVLALERKDVDVDQIDALEKSKKIATEDLNAFKWFIEKEKAMMGI